MFIIESVWFVYCIDKFGVKVVMIVLKFYIEIIN